MSFIGLRNVGPKWSLKDVAKAIAGRMQCKYTVVNFERMKTFKNHKQAKTAYIRLAPNMSPETAVANLQNMSGKGARLVAFIPKDVPDYILEKKTGAMMPLKMADKLNIMLEDRPEVLFLQAHNELLREMQTKYMRLYSVSADLEHELLDAIAEVIFERMRETCPHITAAGELSPFVLTKEYRTNYPQAEDYSMIMSIMHGIEDRRQRPRSEISEKELMNVTPILSIETVPMLDLQISMEKYAQAISGKVSSYIAALDSTIPDDTPERAAKKSVIFELKNMDFYILQIIREVLEKELMKTVPLSDYHMRVYGEPYLPSRELCTAFLEQFHVRRTIRSRRTYNCLLVTVPREQYTKFLWASGTKIGSANMTCRPSDIGDWYSSPAHIQERVQAQFGSGGPGLPLGAAEHLAEEQLLPPPAEPWDEGELY